MARGHKESDNWATAHTRISSMEKCLFKSFALFLAAPQGLKNLISLTGGWTWAQALGIKSLQFWPRDFPPLFIFSETVCPFVVEFCCCWEYVLDIKSLSSYIIRKHFLSLCRLSLHLLIMSFMYTGFNADEIQLVISIVSACAFGVASKLPVTSKVVCNCSMFPSRVLWF